MGNAFSHERAPRVSGDESEQSDYANYDYTPECDSTSINFNARDSVSEDPVHCGQPGIPLAQAGNAASLEETAPLVTGALVRDSGDAAHFEDTIALVYKQLTGKDALPQVTPTMIAAGPGKVMVLIHNDPHGASLFKGGKTPQESSEFLALRDGPLISLDRSEAPQRARRNKLSVFSDFKSGSPASDADGERGLSQSAGVRRVVSRLCAMCSVKITTTIEDHGQCFQS